MKKKRCPGSIGGHPHGYIYYRRRKDGVAICNYCDQPVVALTGRPDSNG